MAAFQHGNNAAEWRRATRRKRRFAVADQQWPASDCWMFGGDLPDNTLRKTGALTMPWKASIRVVDENGEPRRGARVTISFSGPGILESIIGTVGSEYTRSDGWAHFEYENIDVSRMFVDKIWVDGDEVDSGGALESGDTRSYTV